MKPLFSLLLLAFALFTACGDAEAEAAKQAAAEAATAAQNQAYQTMMEGHDRAMGMMGQVTQAQKTIIDMLNEPNVSEERRDLLKAMAEQLEDANDGMMEWMGDVDTLDEMREDNKSADDIMEYIQEKTSGIAKVESEMKSSIAAATKMFGTEAHGHSHDGGDHSHDH